VLKLTTLTGVKNGPLNTTTNFLDAWHFDCFVVYKPELSKAFQTIYASR